MLEKLGSGLREALKKIARAGYIDKAVVDELVKDIQRSLLAGDVDVKLVFELTEKIKQRVLKEKPPGGMTPKEHTVRIVYEELVKFLGKKAEIPIRPTRILLCGLFGSGKCVHPDTIVTLTNGEVISVKDMYDQSVAQEEKIEGGFIKHEPDIEVFSLDPKTLKIVNGRVTALWKLKKTEPLYMVSIDNGNSECISATPEHPFFVLEDGKIIQRRADQLRVGDMVAMPRSLPLREEAWQLPVISALPPAARILHPSTAKRLKRFLKAEFGTLRKSLRLLGVKRPYCGIMAELKRGEVDAILLSSAIKSGFRWAPSGHYKIISGQKKISFPAELTEELAEFMGYLYGDGNMDSRSLHLTNMNDEIINRFVFLSKKLFNLRPSILREKRSKVGLRRITLSSKALVSVISHIFDFPLSKKSIIMSLPPGILTSTKSVTSKFLRAYFDCDGSVAADRRLIEMTTASRTFALQLRLLLLKHGITTSLSTKTINKRNYYRILIYSESAHRFSIEVGSLVKDKEKRLKVIEFLGKGQRAGKLENLHIGSLLEDVRNYYGATIGEIQDFVSSYGAYENKGVISRTALRKFLHGLQGARAANNRLLKYCIRPKRRQGLLRQFDTTHGWLSGCLGRLSENGFILQTEDTFEVTDAGKLFLQKNLQFDTTKIDALHTLAESDLNWGKVKNITRDISPRYVYDLTVDEFHNFVANNIIVHNTTTAAKLARFYQKKGLKPALVCCDVERPAAYEQLQQLAEQIHVPFYGEKGEKDSGKILKDALNTLKADIIIIDSSGRNALDQGMINEIRNLYEIASPEERILVIPADIGQAAKVQAGEFQKSLDITGVIITKMEGTAKGGGALTACVVTGAPVKWIGVGEKIDALELFDPQRFVGRLVGWGDIQALMEKAKEAVEPEKAEKMAEKIMSGKFTLSDFYEQIKSMQRMGPLKSVMEMIPGMPMAKIPKDFDPAKQEQKMRKWAVAIQSMTKEEKENPEIINASRIARISKGSGVPESEIRELLRNYNQSKKMMKMLGGGAKRGALAKLARKFKGGKMF